MSNQALFEKIVSEFTSDAYKKELEEARKEYSEIAGRIFEDDKSFLSYTAFFLDWYIFDRHLKNTNKRPINSYFEDLAPAFTDREGDIYKSFINSEHSIFEVKSVKKEFIVILNLYNEKKYKVKMGHEISVFRKGGLLEARIFPENNFYYMNSTLRFHPSAAGKLIASELKSKRKTNNEINFKEFLMKLGKMFLLWERSRNIEIKDIYKW